jgi:glycine cleavage system aminomethyltransferase T/glycine/D-amino acid oxidase-like deaminating enzyme
LSVQTNASVVIIGAGIVGCSAAYHLTRLGWRDVVVLDQGPLFATGGSSSHAPGLVLQTNSSKTMTTLARRSVELYRQLTVEGRSCFDVVGSLEVATTPERLAELKRRRGLATAWGLEAEMVGPRAAQELVPLLDAELLTGALWVPADGTARAVDAGQAMAEIAGERGATFHGQTRVTAIERDHGRVSAVVTADGQRITADTVLVCAGFWGPLLGRIAGVEIPLLPCQHQYAKTAPLEALAGATREIEMPILRYPDCGIYGRQHGERYGVGSYQHQVLPVDPDHLRRHEDGPPMPSLMPFTPEDFAPAWRDAAELLPALAGSRIEESLNGIFSFTPDGFPLLGQAVDVPGLWVAEAIWVTHAGGCGEVVAEWMTNGTPDLDLHECELGRFWPHALSRPHVWTRAAQQYREVYDIIHPQQPSGPPRPLRVSPFHERQRELGAVFSEGQGWERPRWYAANEGLLDRYQVIGRSGWAAKHWSPIAAAEHLATRAGVALYDMSPLAKLEVSGPGALALLQQLCTNQLDRPAGSVTYTAMLDQRGGIRGDMTIARLAQDRFQVGCNGPLDLDWLRRHAAGDERVQVRDVTGSLCCLGLWGPLAPRVLERLANRDVSIDAFPYFSAQALLVGEVPVTALCLSYVGERGWELYTTPDYGARLWDLLWEAGQELGVIAGGQAAFESLRIEKGYRLWGVDMHTEHDPYEAGIGFVVKFDKGPFTGREALLERRQADPARKLSCLTLDEPGVTVMGKEPILVQGEVAGYVTSASIGQTVACGIAYGYLPTPAAVVGSPVEIEYFGDRLKATVAAEPLYDPRQRRLRG